MPNQNKEDHIQQLLDAEKKATDKVAAAKQRRAKKLKQAKDEAQAEIEAYKAEREAKFQEFVAQHQNTSSAAKIEADTKQRLNDMNRQMANSKVRVIGSIMDYIYDIKPELHQNYAHALYRAEQTEVEKRYLVSNGHPPKAGDNDDINVTEIEEYHRLQCVTM